MKTQVINEQERMYQLIGRMLVILFFSWLGWNVFNGEHIPVANGLGWDGEGYSRITLAFPDYLFGHGLDQYLLQRMLSFGAVYFFFKIFGLSLTPVIMPVAFGALSLVLLLFSVFLWRAIAIKFAWKPEVRLMMLVGLFFNYAILKMNIYYPVLTDITGFFFGLLMLYFYVQKRNYAVLLTTLIGAFAFPTLLYVGIIFFVFPIENNQIAQRRVNYLSMAISFSIALAIIGWCLLAHRAGHKAVGGYYSLPILGMSACALFAYLFAGFSYLVPYCIDCLLGCWQRVSSRIVVAVATFIGLKALMFYLSDGAKGALSFSLFIKNIAVQALAYPFIFIVSHVVYYGPVILLLIYFWKDIVIYIKNKGPGLFIVFGLYFVLSIGSESRQFIAFFPISMFVLGEILNRKKITPIFIYSFICLSLIASKFWLPLNHGEWPSIWTNPPEVTLAFPMQWYFMSQGPWVSKGMYVVNFMLVSLIGLIIYLLSKKGVSDDTYQLQEKLNGNS